MIKNSDGAYRRTTVCFSDPWGGYSFCSEREAEPIALSFVAKGYHAGVLRYHVGENRDFERSLEDAKQALAEIRKIDAKYKSRARSDCGDWFFCWWTPCSSDVYVVRRKNRIFVF